MKLFLIYLQKQKSPNHNDSSYNTSTKNRIFFNSIVLGASQDFRSLDLKTKTTKDHVQN